MDENTKQKLTVPAGDASWRQRELYRRRREWFWQFVVFALVLGLVYVFGQNIYDNLQARDIRSGFAFLQDRASFEIGESLISVSSNDSFARMFLAGMLNTLRVAVVSIVTLCLTLALCLIGIYAVGDNEKQLPDGLSAVENSIAEINVYSEGEERSISIDSYQYRSFASQISNCGGHLLEIQKTSEGGIWNDTDCFIEIIYTADQTIKFENAENFSIECADRLLYNADKNVLYWGEAGYQNCLDYTKMNEEMQAHKEEILKGYEELSTSIRDCFIQ